MPSVKHMGVTMESSVQIFRKVLKGTRKTSEESGRTRENEIYFNRKTNPKHFFALKILNLQMKFFVFSFLYHSECLRPRVPVSLSHALTELSRPHVFADRKDKACETHRNCTCSAISQTKGKEKYWEVKRHDPAYSNQMGTELKFF